MKKTAIIPGISLFLVLSTVVFSIELPPVSQEARAVRGKVTNEAGESLERIKWLVSGLERWEDGEWKVMHTSGSPVQGYTDKDGRFELTFRGKARYDLQISGGGYGPVFLYQVSPATPEIHVVMKKAIVVRGTVVRARSKRPCSSATVVSLRLPNSRGIWFKETSLVDHEGNFRLFACPPPNPPTTPDMTEPVKWQLVCAEEVVPIDIEEGKPVDWVEFEIDVKVTRRPGEHGD
jgi:hypothetical protein